MASLLSNDFNTSMIGQLRIRKLSADERYTRQPALGGQGYGDCLLMGTDHNTPGKFSAAVLETCYAIEIDDKGGKPCWRPVPVVNE